MRYELLLLLTLSSGATASLASNPYKYDEEAPYGVSFCNFSSEKAWVSTAALTDGPSGAIWMTRGWTPLEPTYCVLSFIPKETAIGNNYYWYAFSQNYIWDGTTNLCTPESGDHYIDLPYADRQCSTSGQRKLPFRLAVPQYASPTFYFVNKDGRKRK